MPGPPMWSLSVRFPHQNPVYASPLVHTRYMILPSHSSQFDHPNNIGWVQINTSSLCSFLHSIVTSSLLGPNILLNTLSLLSSFNVSDQVSHPYNTTGRIIFLYILIFKFLDSKLEDKRFCTKWQQTFPDFNPLVTFTWIKFWLIKVVPKYFNSSILPKELLSVIKLWLRPTFWSRNMTIYVVLSAFTSSPVPLLATAKVSAFLFIVWTLPPNMFTSSA